MTLRRAAAVFLGLAATFLSGGCSSGTLAPVSYPEPEVSCPGGRLSWRLEILDQRADREDSERTVSLIRESLSRSFPGCRWEDDPSIPVIRIEVHRFGAAIQGNVWDAAAEWSVQAQSARGQTLTEFQAEAEVSRPNYRGSNNELEALKQVFDQAVRRTVTGLQSMSLME